MGNACAGGLKCVLMFVTWGLATCALALPAPVIKDLAFGESDAKIKALNTLVSGGDSAALPFLQSLLDGEVQTSGEDLVLVVKGDAAVDAVTGKAVAPLPEARDDVVVNNRMRRELMTAVAALKLSSPDRSVRLSAEETSPAISLWIANTSLSLRS